MQLLTAPAAAGIYCSPAVGQRSSSGNAGASFWSATGQQMLESDAIIKYLYDTYGDGKVQRHA